MLLRRVVHSQLKPTYIIIIIIIISVSSVRFVTFVCLILDFNTFFYGGPP